MLTRACEKPGHSVVGRAGRTHPGPCFGILGHDLEIMITPPVLWCCSPNGSFGGLFTPNKNVPGRKGCVVAGDTRNALLVNGLPLQKPDGGGHTTPRDPRRDLVCTSAIADFFWATPIDWTGPKDPKGGQGKPPPSRRSQGIDPRVESTLRRPPCGGVNISGRGRRMSARRSAKNMGVYPPNKHPRAAGQEHSQPATDPTMYASRVPQLVPRLLLMGLALLQCKLRHPRRRAAGGVRPGCGNDEGHAHLGN